MEGPVHPSGVSAGSDDACRLLNRWGIGDGACVEVERGIIGRKWRVQSGRGRFVLKVVPAPARDRFAAGAEAAHALAERGLQTGRPLRSLDGRFVEEQGDVVAALLHLVEGAPVDPDDSAALVRLGAALGELHTALTDIAPPPGAGEWPWRPRPLTAEERKEAPWLAERLGVVAKASEAAVSKGGLAARLVHGDAGPDAFIFDAEAWGVVDWDSVRVAPAVLDIASAYVLAGPHSLDALVTGYSSVRPLPEREIGLIPLFTALRLMLHAAYAVSRMAKARRTGSPPHPVHLRLLEQARLGVEVVWDSAVSSSAALGLLGE